MHLSVKVSSEGHKIIEQLLLASAIGAMPETKTNKMMESERTKKRKKNKQMKPKSPNH